MPIPVAFDERLARALAMQIDGCEFRTVKQSVRSPTSEIYMVIMVAPPYRLEEVAAVFAGPRTDDGEATLQALLSAGVIKFGVDDLRVVDRDDRDSVVLFNQIANTRACRVIYLPPCYVVQLAPCPRAPRRVREHREAV